MSRKSTDEIGVVIRVRRAMYSIIANGIAAEGPKVKAQKAWQRMGLNGNGIQEVVSNLNELSEKKFAKAYVLNANAGVYSLMSNTSR